LMLVAAPLFVLGRPLLAYLWALPPALRNQVSGAVASNRFRRAWRGLTAPLLVLLLHGAVRWAWHAPRLFEAALRSELVHGVQHAMFFFTAAMFWWALANGRYGRSGYGVAVLFVFATGMHTGLLGALITFSGWVWYPMYDERGRAFGVLALEDQQLAGMVMWIGAGLLFLVLGLALFVAWLGEATRQGRETRLASVIAATAETPNTRSKGRAA
jgi:putative membrane protein